MKRVKVIKMILHTIIDLEEVLCEDRDDEYSFKSVNGVLLEGRKNSIGSTVNRIISTNLSDYLNDSYAPGSVFSKSKEIK